MDFCPALHQPLVGQLNFAPWMRRPEVALALSSGSRRAGSFLDPLAGCGDLCDDLDGLSARNGRFFEWNSGRDRLCAGVHRGGWSLSTWWIVMAPKPWSQALQRSSKCPTGLWCVLGKVWQLLQRYSIALAVIGYSDLAVALLRASLLSTGLLGILFVTFDAVRNTSAMLSTDRSAGHDSLAAVVVNAGLMVVSLPIFALIVGGAHIRADGAVVDL